MKMARPASKAKSGVLSYLQVRLDGKIKNEVAAHCRKLGCSMNAWLVEVIRSALREQRGLPEPPPARAPLPTMVDQIREWMAGESVVMPCGKTGSCEGMQKPLFEHDGLGFCSVCEVRVK